MNTFLNIINSIIGTYTPVTYEVTTELSDGTLSSYDAVASGMAGVDWPWVISAAIYALFIYCIFRLIGGIFRR